MKIRELTLLFYSLFLVVCILLYLIYTKQGKENFEPISNYDDEKVELSEIPRISCKPGDKKIIVSWTQTNKNIKNYLIVVREVRSNEKGTMYKVHDKPNCTNCENVITDLINGELYEIYLVGFQDDNEPKIGEAVTVIPNGPLEIDQISSLIMDNKELDFSEMDANCDYYREQNKLGISLDKKYETINQYLSR